MRDTDIKSVQLVKLRIENKLNDDIIESGPTVFVLILVTFFTASSITGG